MTEPQNTYKHIFLVDDDQEDRELFSEALSKIDENTSLVEISSGFELIERLSDPNSLVPDIIFLDINMPKLSGIDCIKKIKSSDIRFKDLEIVILSTYCNPEDIEEAFEQGVSRYYVKPTLFDNLKEIISGALENINKSHLLNKSNFLVHYSA